MLGFVSGGIRRGNEDAGPLYERRYHLVVSRDARLPDGAAADGAAADGAADRDSGGNPRRIQACERAVSSRSSRTVAGTRISPGAAGRTPGEILGAPADWQDNL